MARFKLIFIFIVLYIFAAYTVFYCSEVNADVKRPTLPLNAATETTLQSVVTAIGGITPGGGTGLTSVSLARNIYSSNNVNTSSYFELVTSLPNSVNGLFIFDSSGQTMVLAVGGSGSEVDKYYITPGGNGFISLAIANGARVSIKAVSATATTGEINVTFVK